MSAPPADLGVLGFDHIELACGDCAATWRRYARGLGLSRCAVSDQSTGNAHYASVVLRSGDLVFLFTSPYGPPKPDASPPPHPGYSQAAAQRFQAAHGTGVCAVALRVVCAAAAHAAATARGAVSLLPPTPLSAGGEEATLAEVVLYGDVVLRFVSRPAVPGNSATPDSVFPGYSVLPGSRASFGLTRLDHCVGNVAALADHVPALRAWSGFHEFAEFAAAEVGTLESGLNSVVLASPCERVLLPLNEPTHGTAKRSQIATYLEQHGGPGVQHLALKTDDIFATLRAMRAASSDGGFEFLPPAPPTYYAQLGARIGPGVLSEAQLALCAEYGVLGDRDEKGVLLQIFTKPVGDRATLFLEVIQRVGCRTDGVAEPPSASAGAYPQAAGCGGFGKGNFGALFRAVEAYEATLSV